MAKSVQVQVKDIGGNTDALLAQIPIMVRHVYAPRATRAAGTVVARAARKLCPDSRKTGTRDSWSKKIKSERQGVKQLKDTIGTVTRRYKDGRTTVTVVGPMYPAGSLGHLIEYGHEAVLWGKASPKLQRVPPKPFMRPAADNTKSEQIAAMERVLRAGIEKEAKVKR